MVECRTTGELFCHEKTDVLIVLTASRRCNDGDLRCDIPRLLILLFLLPLLLLCLIPFALIAHVLLMTLLLTVITLDFMFVIILWLRLSMRRFREEGSR